MALLTIPDLEIALGRSLDAEEEPNAQYLINATSDYIEIVTDTAFTPRTGVEIREMADYYGAVHLSPYPVNDVVSVTAVNYVSPTWYWDGGQVIYNLYPNQVVDIVYDYGMSSVPNAVKAAAAEMVKSVVDNLPEGFLKSKQVGDVQHAFSEAAGARFGGLGQSVLAAYQPIGRSYVLGRGYPNPYGYYW